MNFFKKLFGASIKNKLEQKTVLFLEKDKAEIWVNTLQELDYFKYANPLDVRKY